MAERIRVQISRLRRSAASTPSPNRQHHSAIAGASALGWPNGKCTTALLYAVPDCFNGLMRLPHLSHNHRIIIIQALHIMTLDELPIACHYPNRPAKAPSRKIRNGSSMRGGHIPGMRPMGSWAVCVTRRPVVACATGRGRRHCSFLSILFCMLQKYKHKTHPTDIHPTAQTNIPTETQADNHTTPQTNIPPNNRPISTPNHKP